MRKTRSAVKFIVKHTQPYYTITYQRQKLAVKSCKDENGDGQQHVWSALLYWNMVRTRKGVAVVKKGVRDRNIPRLRMRTYHPAVGHTPRTRTFHVQRVLLQLRICSREDDRFEKSWKYMFCQLCAAIYLSHSYVYWCTREM